MISKHNISKADWWSLATLLSQHDLSPNLGNWIIFLSEVLATMITIPGSCPFLETTCHRKLFSLSEYISKFRCSAWGGRSICCFSTPLISNNWGLRGCLGHSSNGHIPSRNLLLSDRLSYKCHQFTFITCCFCPSSTHHHCHQPVQTISGLLKIFTNLAPLSYTFCFASQRTYYLIRFS